jgi:hypothetical protein
MRWFGWLRRRKTVNGDGASSDDSFMYGRKRTRGVPYLMPTDLEDFLGLAVDSELSYRIVPKNTACENIARDTEGAGDGLPWQNSL